MHDFEQLSESNIDSHPKSFISVLLIDNMFNRPNFDIQKITKLNDGIDVSLKTTKLEKAILSKIKNYASLNIGGNAPDFSAPNPEGKMTSLKQSLGKITIIDFWASWCGPCRAENPNVLKLYNEFHSKGLNIIGVSLDKEATKWKEAIAKDKLPWIHVSNLKFWEDPIAQLYNIKSIPATYILDSKGKIIAKDLRGEELNTKITVLLGK
jgi:peroxiredoxin